MNTPVENIDRVMELKQENEMLKVRVATQLAEIKSDESMIRELRKENTTLSRGMKTQEGEIVALGIKVQQLETACNVYQATRDTLKARVVSVLEPFAEVAEKKLIGWVSSAQIASWLDIFLTVGHCRAARALRDELVEGQKAEQTQEDISVGSGKGGYYRGVPGPLKSPLPEVPAEPTCKHCGKVEKEHCQGMEYKWCQKRSTQFTPVPVAEPEFIYECTCGLITNKIPLGEICPKCRRVSHILPRLARLPRPVGSTPATGASWPCDNPLTDVPMDRQVIELNQDNRKLTNENTRLRELLVRLSGVFKSYAEMHKNKGTREGEGKAMANEKIATEIDKALGGQS